MKSTEIECLRRRMHKISLKAQSLTEQSVLSIASELDELVLQEMKRRIAAEGINKAEKKRISAK
ncbi:MAG: Spo0E family sporulation regulatory protein-aspartic acid phosphatase [Firmicutes bacterium]|nr:Spo0E family sporulation regulatory protein-aspartic acid phosphatase [Bacillota bacterium]